MKIWIRLAWAATTIVLPLAACSGSGDLPTLTSTAANLSYHVGPGDKLTIKVLGGDELNGEYIVQSDGTVRLLLVGEIPAAGTTPDQLERTIAERLKSGGFIKNPRVSVAVLSYRPFYILGEVARPGGYPYASGMRVLSAIADASGYTYRANQDYVIITRNGKESRADGLTSIQPDDIIRVPERYF